MFKFGRTSRFEAERTVQKIASNARQFFGFNARTALKESGDATAEANTMFATRVANRVSLKGLSLWAGFFVFKGTEEKYGLNRKNAAANGRPQNRRLYKPNNSQR